MFTLLIGAAIAYSYFAGMKTTVQDMRVTLFGIKLDKDRTAQSAFLKLFFIISFRIENAKPTSAELQGIDVDLFVNGKKIARAAETGSIKILPNTISKANINVSIPTLQVFSIITTAIKFITDKKPLEVNVKGKVLISAGTININETKSVEWPA